MVVSTDVCVTTSSWRPPDLKELNKKRLRNLLKLRRDHEEELNREGVRPLDRAIFAAFYTLSKVVGMGEAISFLKREEVVILEQLRVEQIIKEEPPEEERDVE